MSGWPYTTAAWRNLRRAKLAASPLCHPCELRGRTVLAKAVDHIVAIAKGGPAFPPLTGLMSMCEACHNAKTNAVDHPNASGFRWALAGYDVDGNPIAGWD
jgi:5-methylcytosine-specific restriction endonuclease McrA